MYGGERYETLVASETKIETDKQTDRQTHAVVLLEVLLGDVWSRGV